MIVDSAADQCTCAGPAWKVIYDTGNRIMCSGYISGNENDEGKILPVVSAVTCVEMEGDEAFLLMVNQACYYDNQEQTESLCHPYQAMEHGVKFCLTPRDTLTPEGELGKQVMVVEEKEVPLRYDGRKMFMKIRHPSDEELESLEIVELTSPAQYDPKPDDILQVSNPRRGEKRRYGSYPGGLSMQEWRKRLALAPEDVVRKTFEATTQMAMSVEAENRIVPRQHYKSRFPFLREKRVNDEFHSDTFFPSVTTNKNETCSQIFFGKDSDFMYVKPLKSESHSFTALEDFGREIGIPNTLKTDNAKTEVGRKWTDWCRKYLVSTKFTEPHHPWQNYSEQGIGELGRMVRRCMRAFGAPMSRHGWCQLWCCRVRNCLASRKLNWRTPTEKLTGDTPDISPFRFHFWEEIEWYDIMEKNPHDGWKPGRFLGINDSSGDSMTYFIEVTTPRGRSTVISRSNVRHKRYGNDLLHGRSPTSGETMSNEENTTDESNTEDLDDDTFEI